MTQTPTFAWSPRLLLTDRTVRLPLRTTDPGAVDVDLDGFVEVSRRFCERHATLYLYLQAPAAAGNRRLTARDGLGAATVDIGVRTLAQLRRPFEHNGAAWPRRWPLGQSWSSRKSRQTLAGEPLADPDTEALHFWLTADDEILWRQLPPAEWPRSHFVNCHEGCPRCGTAIFRHHGFYPWQRTHAPADFRSTCPSCGLVVPDNDLLAGDYVSGTIVDDGFGYVGEAGALYLFAATYCRDQTRAVGAAIGQLTAHVRAAGIDGDPEAARRLGLMLLRYAQEEVYVGAVPQFRYGPTLGTERLFEWTTTGQTDWGSAADPVAALHRMGTQRYCIDTPYIADTLALAYDTVWPLLREDDEIPARARACGLEVGGAGDALQLVEEMLACLLQAHLDGGASSNLPRVSEGVLMLLRALQRDDGQDVVTWLYDDGPDALRVFPTNDFFPDGTPPEATGGYNNIHSNGLFSLEHQLRALKEDHPGAYPEGEFESLLADPRTRHVARVPHDIACLGRAFLGFGDGGGPACQRLLSPEAYHAPLPAATLERAARLTGDDELGQLQSDVAARRARDLGMTVLDGVGLAVMRTAERPERAAAGIVYGDATGHRHTDLLDLQLWAFDQPFLSDLGYPQSWATRSDWEGHWSTHNTVWATVPDVDESVGGRGRLVRAFAGEGIQLLELHARRWRAVADGWEPLDVEFRRLVALVDTDDDGVALIDLSRVRGGDEHWRLCRGLEGEFRAEDTTFSPCGGTLADPQGARGDTTSLRHPEHSGLAWFDDVAEASDAAGWSGEWTFAHGDSTLDVHVAGVSDGVQARTARAAAIMGTPDESAYQYRALSWNRTPASADEWSRFDLAFEPRRAAPTLALVAAVPGDQSGSVALTLQSAAGRRWRLWWSPLAESVTATEFEDGSRLTGPLAVADGPDITLVGSAGLRTADGVQRSCPVAQRRGTIVGIDPLACTIDVEGLDGIGVGARLVCRPDGRARNYRVEEITSIDGGQSLRLDVTTLLARARVDSVDGMTIRCRDHVITRTGYVHEACLEAHGRVARVVQASNPGPSQTCFVLDAPLPVSPGDWVHVVDVSVGDEVVWDVVDAG
jgi:hypothetical protein